MDEPDVSSERYPILATIDGPAVLRVFESEELDALAEEIRQFIVEAVTRTGGHLGSNLGAVETTIAMHRVFDSPRDVLLFDTGHQAYVHKLLTGRMAGFAELRQAGGLSGYPNRTESEHDWIENSHASTALSYAHGISAAFHADGEDRYRRVVALVGDGALTGGMAYEALNNLGHSDARVLIVLNDNGRSYAPTVSKLSSSLTQIRLSPSYSAIRNRVGQLVSELPGVGQLAGTSFRNLTSALRELVEPHVFFEALGIRYTGPIDGHDIAAVEQALRNAATWNGPIVLHVLTRKGKGYAPAEEDEIQCLHDLKAVNPISPPGTSADQGAVVVGERNPGTSYTEAFTAALLDEAKRDRRIVAITAAMPGPTGLLPFEARHPDRFFDVGIAEQHAMTASAGMALAGLRPVVAIYSTFLSRAFDQQNLDVGLHCAPVVICADRAGITGDDGPSHHGLLDMVLALAIPDVAVFAPSEPAEIAPMLTTALELERPALIRYPKTPGRAGLATPGIGLAHRVLREGTGEVVIVGIGKMAARALDAAALLVAEGHDVTVVDPRVIRPVDPSLLARLARASLVLTAEDGLVHGGAGQFLRSALEDEAESRGVRPPAVVCLGVPTAYVSHGGADAILARLGLDDDGIARSAADAIARFLPAGLGLGEKLGTSMSVVAGTAAPWSESVSSVAPGVMAKAGSENFSVASRLLPAAVRAHLLAIYGYCRLVDDVGDLAPGDRARALDWVGAELDATFAGRASEPRFVALSKSIAALDLPAEPFERLLAANRLDQDKHRYQDFAELLDYCALSANPVGRLVLAVFSASDPVSIDLSDRVCSGLQVVEHLQDVGEDYRAGRIYLPLEDLVRFGVEESELGANRATPALRRLLAFESGRAAELLAAGPVLAVRLHGAARIAISGFVGGGLAQLDAIAAADYDVLARLAKASKAKVAARSLGVFVRSGIR